METNNSSLPRSPKEAKRLGLKVYFTGKECSRQHLAPRFASTASCTECMKMHFNSWREKNVEKDRRDSRRWQINNRAKVIAAIARYEAGRDKRTPKWADPSKIAAVYVEARRLSSETGIEHHVDHVIPLHGKRVSGLHVHNNLCAIPAEINKKKSNSYEIG